MTENSILLSCNFVFIYLVCVSGCVCAYACVHVSICMCICAHVCVHGRMYMYVCLVFDICVGCV